MKIDSVLVKEILKANGNGSREDKFSLLRKITAVKKELSTPDVTRTFDRVFERHERAHIAICLAATIVDREDRLDYRTVEWGREVLRLYTNRPSTLERIVIEDGLHPTRIEEYAGNFIRLTTE